MSRNIAVIGNGYWGKNLVRNFYQLGVLRLVCDENPAAQVSLRAQYGDVEFETSLSAVLHDKAVDGVVIATPAATHFRVASAALKAGKDVFVEKPLALNYAEGLELAELADRERRILMVGHLLQYHPGITKLKQLTASGALGRLQYLYSNRLNIGKIRTEENILWSFAPHDISVILSLLNDEPTEVSCAGDFFLNRDVVDVTLSRLVFRSGIQAHIFVSWLHPFKEQRLVVVGSERMAVFDDTAADKLVLYPHRIEWKHRIPTAIKATAEVVELEDCEPLGNECREFLDCIISRRTPLTDAREGLQVLSVLDACQRSLEQGGTVQTGAAQTHTNKRQVYSAHPTATIAEDSQVGEGTKIWHFSHVMKGAKIGRNCNFGQNCHIAGDVVIGDNVKVQNNVSIYSGAAIEDDVFLGPSCVLTNVSNPRSQINRHALYQPTIIRRGATVGANATILCGVELGRYCFIGAGSVVTHTVADYALVMGNPARHVGWMSRHGHRLHAEARDGVMVCPESKYRYKEISPGLVRCLDLDENEPLPQRLTTGALSYRDFSEKKQAVSDEYSLIGS